LAIRNGGAGGKTKRRVPRRDEEGAEKIEKTPHKKGRDFV